MVAQFETKTAAKQAAQDLLMDAIGNALGYWQESSLVDARHMTEAEQADFRATLKAQADRVAKLFGYPEAWSN